MQYFSYWKGIYVTRLFKTTAHFRRRLPNSVRNVVKHLFWEFKWAFCAECPNNFNHCNLTFNHYYTLYHIKHTVRYVYYSVLREKLGLDCPFFTLSEDLINLARPNTTLALALMLCINYTSYNMINLVFYMIYNISICLFYDRSARAG